MIGLFVLILSVVIASGVCSMTEAAILSLSHIRARILHEEKRRNSEALLYLKENISVTVASIVVLNNAINIMGSVFVGHQVTTKFGNQWLGLASTALTFTIIVVSEIIPKTIGERYKIPLSLMVAPSLKVVVLIFRPLVRAIIILAKPFMQMRKKPRVTEEEIKMMLKLGRVEGTVEMDEEQLCNRVFKLNDLRAAQIMKPFDQIFALPADKTLRELKDEIINTPYSRIAVFEKDPKDFIGIAQQRILLREIAKDNYDARLRDFMSKPIFVHQLTKADTLLEKFQLYHQHLFIVQDNVGQDIGIVTMEDVLEELFGEIYDEKDSPRRLK